MASPRNGDAQLTELITAKQNCAAPSRFSAVSLSLHSGFCNFNSCNLFFVKVHCKRVCLLMVIQHLHEILTRNSAIADKLRDAFRCQSRSPNMVPFHVLGMDSHINVCYGNIVPKTRHVSEIRLQKCRDLEIRVRGHLRSLKVVPFDRLYMVSYYYPIVTLSVLRYSTSKMT